MIEVERKFRLHPGEAKGLELELSTRHGPLTYVTQTDVVFLYGMRSFDNFKRGMPVIRLRNTDGAISLAVKKSISHSGDALEHEVSVSDYETTMNMLHVMGFERVTEVTKTRGTVCSGQVSFMIDRVAHVGDFLEVETLVANAHSIDSAVDNIMSVASSLGLFPDRIETRKYDQLVSAAVR